MRKPTETQAVWIFCSAVILLNVVGDCVWKMPDIIPNDAVALGVLVLSSFYCFVSIDVRRATQRLRPSVPLVMSKASERFMRFNGWMVASLLWYVVVRHYFRVWNR